VPDVWLINVRGVTGRLPSNGAPGNVQDVFSYLEGLGYEGSFVWRNQVFPVSTFDAALHQRQHGEWFWKSKDYCNNFIFRKPRDRS